MTIREAIMNRRSIRKFSQEPINYSELLKLVEYAAMAATGGNLQPLKFKIASSKELTNQIFPHIKWAAYLDNASPLPNERPTAYIAVFGDLNIKQQFECDAGAAVTNMMLGAYEYGIASCWLGAIDRDALCDILCPPDNMRLLYLLALGYPSQKSRAVEKTSDSIKYWLDSDGVLNVPKRPLSEILID